MPHLTYSWKRFWCLRTGTINLLDGGYLYAPHSDVVPFESISSTPCLILLGEPGIGKTFAMQAERASIDSQVAQLGGKTLWLDLRQFGDETRLIHAIFEDEVFVAWRQGTYQLHIFLDALDEALLRIDTISAILSTELQKYPIKRLYLRIACRTADWPNDLEQGLLNIWGKEPIQVFELAPLQRRDVVEAAQANELDPTAFLKEIDRVEVVPLAIKPVTLDLLINIYKRHGNLPATQTELYLQGCRLLCELPSLSQSRSIQSRYILSADQRLAIAARIAAVTVFSRRFAVWTDINRGNIPQEDVTVQELSVGKEMSNGVRFDVTEKGVRETLATGLFSSRGLNRLGWSHQTYAEFLAARYLVENHLTLPQMMSLIVHSKDPERKLVPQLYETAAWLAGIVPDVFREIIKSDPQVLLKSAVAKANLKDREALVRSLLSRYDQEQLVDFDWELRKTYRKLDYPQLADQVCPYIIDNSKDIMVRRVAINIAEACKLQVIQKELTDVAVDVTAPHTIRVNAAYAVSRIADDATKARLKPLALSEGGDDPDDQLKGVALLALWPSQMTIEELFLALTPPKRQNLLGAYQGFISPNLVQHIQPSDLPIALSWAENQSIGRGLESPFSDVIDAIMLKAWKHLELPDVLQAFARAILKRLEHYDGIIGERGNKDDTTKHFIDELINQDYKRHRLLEALLPLIEKLENNWIWLVFQTPLLLDKDIPWLIVHLKTASNEAEQQQWALLIEKLAGWSAPTQLDVLIGETQEYPPLVKALEKLKADYPEKEKLRSEWQHERHVELVTPSPQERVATLLNECEKKDSGAWWRLIGEMTLEPTSTHYGNEFKSDLTDLPGWKSADEKTRSRILSAATRFLLEQSPNTPEWLGKHVYHLPALAGYKALELLLRESPDSIATLPPDVWKNWAPAIPTFPNKGSSDDEYHSRLIRLSYQYAPNEIIETVLKIIDKENQAHGNIFITFQLRSCWDERLSSAILEKLNDTALKPDAVGCLLGDLLDHKVDKAKKFAETLVALSSSRDDVERSKATIAAHALLTYADDAGWSSVWPVIQRDAEFGRTVITTIANFPERDGANVAQRLSENQLADLYVWLERNYPHAEDPQIEGIHSVSDRETIGHWRDGLLQQLKYRGTPEAVKAIQRIVKEFPELQWLRWTLLETRDLARRGTWEPLRPADIINLTASQQAKPARSHLISIRSLIGGLILSLLGIAGGLITGWIQQDVLKNSFTPQWIVIILILMVVGTVASALLQDRGQTKS